MELDQPARASRDKFDSEVEAAVYVHGYLHAIAYKAIVK
jgi:hypothetical protein